MIRHLRKRKGYLLPQVLAMLMMLSVIGIASLTQLSAFLSGVEAGGDGLQAKQYASIKADAITSYTAAADEARTLYPGSEFETETIIGPETDLGSGNKQKIATVNVYKTGDSEPRFTLLKPLSSQGSGNSLPAGTIVIWSGSVATIPSGWTLCNGANGTPDLRSRFVFGSGSDTDIKWGYSTGWNAPVLGHCPPGWYGGEEMHQLTLAEMPSHNHSVMAYGQTSDNSAGWLASTSGNGGSYYHSTLSAGGSVAHNIMPRFYALAYIMKL